MANISKIKYLVFDLDDTLLRSDRTLSSYTISILKKAQENHYKIIFNTSRSYQNSKQYIDLVKPDYGIYNGGCQIVDKEGKELFANYIDKKEVKEVTKFLYSKCHKISVQTKDNFFASDKEYKAQNAIWFDFKDGLEVDAFKILFFTLDKAFANDVSKKYNLELQNYLNGGWNRLASKDANKINGLIKFLSLFGGSLDEVAAFGDDFGDKEMIEKSAYGFAMANSRKEVLETAKYITLTNDEDGCAVAVEKYFLK